MLIMALFRHVVSTIITLAIWWVRLTLGFWSALAGTPVGVRQMHDAFSHRRDDRLEL